MTDGSTGREKLRYETPPDGAAQALAWGRRGGDEGPTRQMTVLFVVVPERFVHVAYGAACPTPPPPHEHLSGGGCCHGHLALGTPAPPHIAIFPAPPYVDADGKGDCPHFLATTSKPAETTQRHPPQSWEDPEATTPRARRAKPGANAPARRGAAPAAQGGLRVGVGGAVLASRTTPQILQDPPPHPRQHKPQGATNPEKVPGTFSARLPLARFCGVYRVAQEHRDGHGAYAAGDWGDVRGVGLCGFEVYVAGEGAVV